MFTLLHPSYIRDGSWANQLKKAPKIVTENPFTKYQLCGTNGQYFLFGHIPSNDDKDEQPAYIYEARPDLCAVNHKIFCVTFITLPTL